MSEIGAALDHLQLLSPKPEALARFYAKAYGMQAEPRGPHWVCAAEQRRLVMSPGAINHLGFAAFSFTDAGGLDAYRKLVVARVAITPNPSPMFDANAFAVTDPQGNVAVFGVREAGGPAGSADPPPARLQHFAMRSTHPAELMAFYRDRLGFIVSDRVEDGSGRIRACFLRIDNEHHALAIFDSPDQRHDHLSFETRDWTAMRDWADRVAKLDMPIVWGIGRHGPGNDVFFMIRDPDGNLAEISAELEVCAPGRPEGLWPHGERTLNQWGMAIMRS